MFKFGDLVKNVSASKTNPHRTAIYVRTIQTRGRLNKGTWIEVTNGHGDFWRIAERSIVLQSMPEKEADAVFEAIWQADYGKATRPLATGAGSESDAVR
jgi:hypothetical protein